MLDIAACRALHDPAAAPWPDVAAILQAFEVGAREGHVQAQPETETDDGR